MKALSLIHRWAGSFLGLLLALLGLTGAILVWEGEWIGLPGAGDAVTGDGARLAAVTEAASAAGRLSRITFASDEIGLHQMVYADGSGAYVRQDGTMVDHWSGMWERPELWLFDLHHYLFAGEAGELVTGVAGIAGLLFVVSGVLLWWRNRGAFRLRAWPARLAPGPVVSHHRDLGILAAPLLAVSLLTGVLMLFAPIRTLLLGTEQRPRQLAQVAPGQSVAQVLALAAARFPQAEIRRVTLPTRPGEPVAVRMRQPFEWTPNGRTQITVAADGRTIIEDAANGNGSAWLAEKIYPVHSGKVGGLVWKIALTASGLALALLGSLATWSFWTRRAGRRVRGHVRARRSDDPPFR